jgi:hypothetical protein
MHACPQHACADCGRGATEAGGMLFRYVPNDLVPTQRSDDDKVSHMSSRVLRGLPTRKRRRAHRGRLARVVRRPRSGLDGHLADDCS